MANVGLPLCSTGKPAMRDQWAGQNAHIRLPFYQYGFWFASGQQYTFPSSQIAQYEGITNGSEAKPNTFKKSAGWCA